MAIAAWERTKAGNIETVKLSLPLGGKVYYQQEKEAAYADDPVEILNYLIAEQRAAIDGHTIIKTALTHEPRPEKPLPDYPPLGKITEEAENVIPITPEEEGK